MIYTIYPCPVSFCPSVSFCPLYHFAPFHFPPPPPPPGNHLMIYAIYPCPVSFCPLDSFCPHIILPPVNLLMYTICPCPVSFCPLSFCPLEIVSWFTLFTHVQYHLSPGFILPPYHFAPWKWFNDLHYLPMSRIILPPALDFVFILIKSHLQQKLMTGAHPVTVAPLVWLTTAYFHTCC